MIFQINQPVFGLVNFVQTITSVQKTRSIAGYAQATYNIFDDTGITAGIRYTSEQKRFDSTVTNNFLPLTPSVPDKTTYKKPTYRVAIDHHFNKDVMAYISFNTGYKSGGYDVGQVPNLNKFNPESLNATEIGLKTDLLDRKLRINLAAYHYSYSNVQLTTFLNGLPFDYNATKATINGIDVDILAKITPELTLNAGGTLMESKLGDFLYNPVAQRPTFPYGNFVVTPAISAKGNRLPNSPNQTFNVGVNYKAMSPIGYVELSADYNYTSKWFAQIDNRLAQDAYGVANASFSWQPKEESPYRITFWGRNLGNTVYAAQLVEGTSADTQQLASGRTYGVTISAKY